MRPLAIKIFLLFALLVASPAFADDAESKGLDALRHAAEQGNADAQYELGILYEFGYNFTDHKASAYVWYSRAAEQGNALAAKRRDTLKGQVSAAEIDRANASLKAPPVPTPAPAQPPAPTASTSQ